MRVLGVIIMSTIAGLGRAQVNETEIDPDCTSWFDGCNKCLAEDGQILGCTRMFCFEQDEPKCLEFKKKEASPPKNCKTWFDGCNTCAALGESKSDTPKWGCTRMLCSPETLEDPECVEFFQEERALEIPDNCVSFWDGCNSCLVENGGLLGCTTASCANPTKPRCLKFRTHKQASNVKIPANCVTWYDGCNNCGVKDGVIGRCTRKFCDDFETPRCIQEAVAPPKPKAPENCASFFDGCNTCQVEGGELVGCTEMSCLKTSQPECLSFRENKEVPKEVTPPAGCLSWFDGCNKCRVLGSGALACTKMFCADRAEPKCLRFSKGRSAALGSSTVLQTDFVLVGTVGAGCALLGGLLATVIAIKKRKSTETHFKTSSAISNPAVSEL